MRRVGAHLGVIAVLSLPAVVLWWHAWAGGAAATVRCACLDPGQQVWFVAWPAYALVHWHDPFSTSWLWPPGGVNLLANASAPLVGLVLAPVTWVLGPFVSTTLALTLAPGLSAWGCWVACRRLVDWAPAPWVAGLVFGYSPFVVESVGQGHVSVALLVFPPLVLVVLHEIVVRQRWSPARCGAALSLLALGQFLVSPEMLTVVLVVAVVGIALAAALAPHRVGASAPFALRAFAFTVVFSQVLLALPAWYLLTGPRHIVGALWGRLHGIFVAQAWGLWRAGPWRSTLFPGVPLGPQVQFLGFGLLAVAAGSVAVAWRNPTARLMAGVAVVATVLSWGGLFWPAPGHLVVAHWLPWGWVTNLPVLDDVSAVHFAAPADLAVAVLVALGLDSLARWRWWRRLPDSARDVAVVGLVALMVVPAWRLYDAPLAVQRVSLPRWYQTAGRSVPEGSVVLSYPFPASASLTAEPMVWQAADSMRFRLAGGYVKVPAPGGGVIGSGPPGSAVRTLVDLTIPKGGRPPRLSATDLQRLRAALVAWGTSYVVVTDTGALPQEAAAVFTAATGRLPAVWERAWVWDLAARPLGRVFSSPKAAAALASCEAALPALGGVPAGQPLPQALDRCVSGGQS